MLAGGGQRVGAPGGQLLLGQRLLAGGRFTSPGICRPVVSEAVLVGQNLQGVPQLVEHVAEDASMAGHVPVVVQGSFPGADRRQVRWCQGGNPPLVDGVVGDPAQRDLPGGPVRGAGPLDGLVVVEGLLLGQDLQVALRGAGASRVDPNYGVSGRRPQLRIDGLEGHVGTIGQPRDLRVLGDEVPPAGGVRLVLEPACFPVGSHRHDDRRPHIGVGAINIRPQNHAVRHRDRRIETDPHPVANRGLVLGHRTCSRPG